MIKILLTIYLVGISIAIVYTLTLSVVAITPFSSATSHHEISAKCKWPFSKLYVFTEPVQSECVELTHNEKVVKP